MSAQQTPGRLYIRTNRHPNTDGTPWGWVDLYEPGSMRQASPEGIQATWSRGQKSEANARRLVACWNACEGISTDALERLGTLDRARVDLDVIRTQAIAQRDELLAALLTARDHIDMDALEISHCKDAERIRTAIAKANGATE